MYKFIYILLMHLYIQKKLNNFLKNIYKYINLLRRLKNNKCKMIIQKEDNIFREMKKIEKKINNFLSCQF